MRILGVYFLLVLLLGIIGFSGCVKNIVVTVDTQKLVNTVPATYLSVTLDSSLVKERWRTFDFKSSRLHTLAAGLAPCVLRFGGTEADFLVFNPDVHNENDISKVYSNFTMSKSDWDNLNQFCASVGWQLLFDFNVLLRRGTDWDPSNALDILHYTVQQGYQSNIHFELGNEPNAFKHAVGREVSGTQLGKDFLHLRTIVHEKFQPYFSHSLLVGPDVTKPKVKSSGSYAKLGVNSLEYLQEYLSVVNNTLDAITWHQYYISGRTATIDDFTDPNVLALFLKESLSVRMTLEDAGHGDTPLWLGETSSAWGGGAPQLSDTYVAGFMWLDKLGAAAKMGHRMVMRQSFYKGHYAILDDQLQPLPDYWLSLLYKRLVGGGVFNARHTDLSGYIRLYAHCTNKDSYKAGGVTLYGMNLQGEAYNLTLTHRSDIHQFLLTPHGEEGLQSQLVNLNGNLLEMQSDTELPVFKPVIYKAGESVILPPKSFAFYVLPDLKVSLC